MFGAILSAMRNSKIQQEIPPPPPPSGHRGTCGGGGEKMRHARAQVGFR